MLLIFKLFVILRTLSYQTSTNQYVFHLSGFKRKEFRGKLAIAITANFINRNTQAEARVEEISGVAFIFNQKFFKDLYANTGIDLENIVYYKDETHYFVMTAKKHSLLRKGVLIQDFSETEELLDRRNVNQEKLLDYAKEAADFSTNHQLPVLDFAHNHVGQADVAMFDFTSLFQAVYSSRMVEKEGHKLLMSLVGDSLLEPFWPTGSGCARGFLGAMDTAWMIRNLASGKLNPLEVLAERESVYQLLSQCTPENMNKNFSQYTIDPNSRYPNLNSNFFKPYQMTALYEGGDPEYLQEISQVEERNKRYVQTRDYHHLLRWFQKQLDPYQNLVQIVDLTSSWRSGVALCALISRFRPNLIDLYSIDANEVAKNNQMAFDVAEKEFDIEPIMTGEDMAEGGIPNRLTMVSYLSQFYEFFKKESIKLQSNKLSALEKERSLNRNSPSGKVGSKLGSKVKQRRQLHAQHAQSKFYGLNMSSSSEDENMENKEHGVSDKEKVELQLLREHGIRIGDCQKKIKDITMDQTGFQSKFSDIDTKLQEAKRHLEKGNTGNLETGVRGQNKVSELAKELGDRLQDFHKPKPISTRRLAPKPLIMGHTTSSECCYFCNKKVYLMERQHAEGVFFHRWCLRCDFCGTGLRLGSYCYLRTDDGESKFFCFQHYGLKRKKTGKIGKRVFGDREVDVEEEKRKIHRARLYEADELPEIKIKVPRRKSNNVTNSDLTDALLPPSPSVDLNKTPERIEFENVIDGAEESELEQTTHNLSTYVSEDEDEDDTDSDETDDEEELSFDEDDDPDLGFAAYESSCKRAEGLHGRKYQSKSDDADGESDTETETFGDSSDEWDSETEKESDSMEGTSLKETKNTMFDAQQESIKAKEPQKPSPASLQLLKNKMSFFSAAPQVVRIDANRLFGLKNEPTIVKHDEPEQLAPEFNNNKNEDIENLKTDEQLYKSEEESDVTEQEEDYDNTNRILADNNILCQDLNKDLLESTEEVNLRNTFMFDLEVEAVDISNEIHSDSTENLLSEDEALIFDESEGKDKIYNDSEGEQLPEEVHDIVEGSKELDFEGTLEDNQSFDNVQIKENKTILSSVEKEHKYVAEIEENTDSVEEYENGENLTINATQQNPIIIPVLKEEDFIEPSCVLGISAPIERDNALQTNDPEFVDLVKSETQVENLQTNITDDVEQLAPETSLESIVIPVVKDEDFIEHSVSESFALGSHEIDSNIQHSHRQFTELVCSETKETNPDSEMHDNIVEHEETFTFVCPSQVPGDSSNAVQDYNGGVDNNDFKRQEVVSELSPDLPPLAETDDFDIGLETPLKDSVTFSLSKENNVEIICDNIDVDNVFDGLPVDVHDQVTRVDHVQAKADDLDIETDTAEEDLKAKNKNVSNEKHHETVCDIVDVIYINGEPSVPVEVETPSEDHKQAKPDDLDIRGGNVFEDSKTLNLLEREHSETLSDNTYVNNFNDTSSGVAPDPSSMEDHVKDNNVISTSHSSYVPDQTSVEGHVDKNIERRTSQNEDDKKLIEESSSEVKPASSNEDVDVDVDVISSNESSITDSVYHRKEHTQSESSATNSRFVSLTSTNSQDGDGDISDSMSSEELACDVNETIDDLVGSVTPYKSLSLDNIVLNNLAREDDELLCESASLTCGNPTVNGNTEHFTNELIIQNSECRKSSESVPATLGKTNRVSETAQETTSLNRYPKSGETNSVSSVSSSKKRFFSEQTQPVRIDPSRLFSKDKAPVRNSVSKSRTETYKNENMKAIEITGPDLGLISSSLPANVDEIQVFSAPEISPDLGGRYGEEKRKRRSFLGIFFPSKDKKDANLKSEIKKDKSKKQTKKVEESENIDRKTAEKSRSIKNNDQKKRNIKETKIEDNEELQAVLAKYASTSTPVVKELPSVGRPGLLDVDQKKSEAPKFDGGLKAPKATVDECEITDFDSEFDLLDDTASVCSFTSHKSFSNKSDKHKKKMQRAALRQQRQAEQKRLRIAQEIQRQLEETDIKIRGVEEKGVTVEQELHKKGTKASDEENYLMEQWFNIVHEKNALVRYQSELMIQARELDLEDRQARLQQRLRDLIGTDEGAPTSEQRDQERKILEELLEVVEQRDVLVTMLEEDRQKAKAEDKDLKAVMQKKGFNLAPLAYQLRLPSMRDLDTSC